MGPMMGKARASLDGASVTVDLYRQSAALTALARTGLPVGTHTLSIEVLGERNPSATGYYVTIDALQVAP